MQFTLMPFYVEAYMSLARISQYCVRLFLYVSVLQSSADCYKPLLDESKKDFTSFHGRVSASGCSMNAHESSFHMFPVQFPTNLFICTREGRVYA
uniref:Uncharacterized protein n=1 Tax=Thermosporothrix sp. COM3 TaxID=2490863 RepID=A0A455STZ5_9CHLR|nr:hypothetical protein KTC_33750 [Thermosporothrix sp. COM3]